MPCRKGTRASCTTTAVFPIRAPAATNQTPDSIPRRITELLRGERHTVLTGLMSELDSQRAVVQSDGHRMVAERAGSTCTPGNRASICAVCLNVSAKGNIVSAVSLTGAARCRGGR